MPKMETACRTAPLCPGNVARRSSGYVSRRPAARLALCSHAVSMHTVVAASAPRANVSPSAAQNPAAFHAAGREKEPAPTAHLTRLIAAASGGASPARRAAVQCKNVSKGKFMSYIPWMSSLARGSVVTSVFLLLDAVKGIECSERSAEFKVSLRFAGWRNRHFGASERYGRPPTSPCSRGSGAEYGEGCIAVW